MTPSPTLGCPGCTVSCAGAASPGPRCRCARGDRRLAWPTAPRKADNPITTSRRGSQPPGSDKTAPRCNCVDGSGPRSGQLGDLRSVYGADRSWTALAVSGWDESMTALPFGAGWLCCVGRQGREGTERCARSIRDELRALFGREVGILLAGVVPI